MTEEFVSSLSVDVSKEPIDLLLAGKDWSISIDRKNGVRSKVRWTLTNCLLQR